MQVQLFKKVGNYTDNEGKSRKSVRFYVQCNNSLIPIEPTYFTKKDENGQDLRDFQYSGRKQILESFADDLPDKEKKQ